MASGSSALPNGSHEPAARYHPGTVTRSFCHRVDNSYGKLSMYYQLWLTGVDDMSFSSRESAALAL